MRSTKYFLITSYSKLNFKFGSNLIFIDDYLFHLYSKKELQKYNCFIANKLENCGVISQTASIEVPSDVWSWLQWSLFQRLIIGRNSLRFHSRRYEKFLFFP